MGTIGAPWGLKGWVKVWSVTSPPESLLEHSQFRGESQNWTGELKVVESKPQGRFLAFKFAGCDNRDAAERLKGAEIQLLRSSLPAPEPGEYYWHDLIGLDVTTREGVPLGQIVEMMETGANDVMVIQGERRRWVPYLEPDVVVEINLTKNSCLVDWDPDF
ncbi:MAG: 16S rRNA processing protein RimM [Immundisolibacteraceae bacterium]|nr:16S rRNA processing protein RimM [Immundisolibacteraceae bacterium]